MATKTKRRASIKRVLLADYEEAHWVFIEADLGDDDGATTLIGMSPSAAVNVAKAMLELANKAPQA